VKIRLIAPQEQQEDSSNFRLIGMCSSKPLSLSSKVVWIVLWKNNGASSVMTKILADNHQTESRSDLTLGTKTIHVARVLDPAMISIANHLNGFYNGG